MGCECSWVSSHPIINFSGKKKKTTTEKKLLFKSGMQILPYVSFERLICQSCLPRSSLCLSSFLFLFLPISHYLFYWTSKKKPKEKEKEWRAHVSHTSLWVVNYILYFGGKKNIILQSFHLCLFIRALGIRTLF